MNDINFFFYLFCFTNLRPVAGWPTCGKTIAVVTGAVPNPPKVVVLVEKLNDDVTAGLDTPNPPKEGVTATAWIGVVPNPDDCSPRLG